jgi:hypothetical protein
MLTIMMSLVAVFAAHAQDDIFIGDMRIAYERGYFDQNTLQGDVSDIRFYAGNDYLGSSERLVLDYDIIGGLFKLNTFLVEGMRMNDENMDIYLSRMSIEDMVMDDQFLDTVIGGGISVYRTGDIVVNDLDIEAEGSRISIERFSISNIPILPYEGASIPDYDSEFILEKLTIALSPYDPTLAEYHMMLNMLGINDITMNANSIASHRNVGNRYRQVSTADIELVGLGTFETYGDLEYLKPTYHMMNQSDFENIEPDQALLMLSSLGGGIFINSLELSYRDKGLMDYALSLAGQTSGMTRGDIADMTVMTMQAELMQYPDLANMVIPPLEQFIKRGGRLVVSIEPTVSLPIISLPPLMSSPAEAINVLGIRVSN